MAQMQLVALGAAFSLAPLLVVACGDDAGSGGAAAAVAISVTSSTRERAIAGLDQPTAGYVYVVLQLSLENRTASSIALNPTLFSLVAKDGVEYRGDPITEAYDGGCSSQTSLASDGATSCAVVFSAPLTVATKSVQYTTEDGKNTYSTPFELEECTPCGVACIDPSCSCNNNVPYCNPATTCEEAGAAYELRAEAAGIAPETVAACGQSVIGSCENWMANCADLWFASFNCAIQKRDILNCELTACLDPADCCDPQVEQDLEYCMLGG